MKRKIGDYINKKNTNQFTEIDFHDFVEMIQAGMKDEEVANELGIHKSYIEKIKNDMSREY
ncbi:hypothetical protein IZY60_01075 [Lutibacter sp. B2]|nr:hypothetical protein [Lutibacter sp. B2]